MTKITHQETPQDGDRPRVPGFTQKETYANTGLENKKLIDTKAEAVHMILNEIVLSEILYHFTRIIIKRWKNSREREIGNDIYSTMDACPNIKEMWIAIERLQQGESINIQDVKTKLLWEFDKFTSMDGESIESYHTRFYRMMNEMNKGKEIVKQPSRQSESASEEESDEEHAQRDMQIQKSLALIAKHFKNIYKPTNNIITLSNTKNKNVDTSPRTRNDKNTGMFVNQRTVAVAWNKETECRKSKRVKDYEYHKEKMMMYKQESKGIPLSAEQDECLQDTDEESNEQELEAHYMYMAKIQEVLHAIDDNSGPTYDAEPLEKVHTSDNYNVFATERQHSEQPESINNTYVVKTVDSNIISDSTDMCDNVKNDEQNTKELEDECVLLASLIENLKLDVDENKKIKKQSKKANTSLTQELDKYKLDPKYCKIKLERNKTFQTNQKDKEIDELKCKEALDLLASNNHKNA
ncbi:hypothetical protein Tco_1548360 [Tanacetum coccineum]